ncbi:hypothetical protein HDU98_012251 [Podochytrium sp. JEL0797]|nr:hypothetical protein HDU98_012251 [Podochytrium sp. JEL0797]
MTQRSHPSGHDKLAFLTHLHQGLAFLSAVSLTADENTVPNSKEPNDKDNQTKSLLPKKDYFANTSLIDNKPPAFKFMRPASGGPQSGSTREFSLNALKAAVSSHASSDSFLNTNSGTPPIANAEPRTSSTAIQWKHVSEAMGASVTKLISTATTKLQCADPTSSSSTTATTATPLLPLFRAFPVMDRKPTVTSEPVEEMELEILVLGAHEDPPPRENYRQRIQFGERKRSRTRAGTVVGTKGGGVGAKGKASAYLSIFGDTASSVGPETPRVEDEDAERQHSPMRRSLDSEMEFTNDVDHDDDEDGVVEAGRKVQKRPHRGGSLGANSSFAFGKKGVMSGGRVAKRGGGPGSPPRKGSLGASSASGVPSRLSPWRATSPEAPFLVSKSNLPPPPRKSSAGTASTTKPRGRTLSSFGLTLEGTKRKPTTGGSRSSLAIMPSHPHHLVSNLHTLTTSVGELITSVFRSTTAAGLMITDGSASGSAYTYSAHKAASGHHMSPFESDIRALRESSAYAVGGGGQGSGSAGNVGSAGNSTSSVVSFVFKPANAGERRGSFSAEVAGVGSGGSGGGRKSNESMSLEQDRQSLINQIPLRHLNTIRTKNSVDLNSLNQLLNAKIEFTAPSGGFPISTFSVICNNDNAPREKKRHTKSIFGSQPLLSVAFFIRVHGGDRLGFAIEAVKRKNKVESYQRLIEPTGTLGSVIPDYDIYDPLSLDDPELKTGKHRTVIKLQSYVSSIFLYSRPAEIKKELNEVFRETHPSVDPLLSLSHIRSLKQRMIRVGKAVDMEWSSVACAMVYFEKLVFRNFAVRANRRVIASVCLLLAAKTNDNKEFNYNKMLEAAETVMEVSAKEVFQQEFATFVALEFTLFVPLWQLMPHLERIVEVNPKNKSLEEYLQGRTFFMGGT